MNAVTNEAKQTVSSETYTNTFSHKIIKLTDAQGVVSWMLFTEERKIVHVEKPDSSEIHSDEVKIKLRALGSFHKNVRKEEKTVMEMRGRAFSAPSGTVNFSDGYIKVEDSWQGIRIGTYMMNHLVAWAKEHYSDLQPVGITLTSLQAGDAESKERRNRFYNRFKFRFIWDDVEHRGGHLDPDQRISDLAVTNKWEERIKEFSLEDGMSEIFSVAQQQRFDCLDAQRQAQFAIEARNRAEADTNRVRTERTRWGMFGLLLGFVAALMLKVW